MSATSSVEVSVRIGPYIDPIVRDATAEGSTSRQDACTNVAVEQKDQDSPGLSEWSYTRYKGAPEFLRIEHAGEFKPVRVFVGEQCVRTLGYGDALMGQEWSLEPGQQLRLRLLTHREDDPFTVELDGKRLVLRGDETHSDRSAIGQAGVTMALLGLIELILGLVIGEINDLLLVGALCFLLANVILWSDHGPWIRLALWASGILLVLQFAMAIASVGVPRILLIGIAFVLAALVRAHAATKHLPDFVAKGAKDANNPWEPPTRAS